jgi:simple sugar transport system permease protein
VRLTAAPLPGWATVAVLPLLNVAAALIVGGLVVLAIGEDPIDAVTILVRGAFGSAEGFGFTLYYATNFVFTGLAVAVAVHAGLFNIGGEGQAYVGGLGAALVVLALDTALPGIIVLPLAIVAAALFGAAWAFIPALLQAKRGSHIVITTIMFNFLASALMVYLLVNVIVRPGSMAPETRHFNEAGHLPQMQHVASALGFDWPSSPLNLAFPLALLVAWGVWVLLWRTRLGYEMRTSGHSPSAAAYAGISPARITVVAMLISGALAGLMSVNEILGVQQRLILDFPGGAGFVGIAVALMGRSHPMGVVLASILFGALYQGGNELAFDMPTITRDMIVVIQGLVILFAGALENLFARPLSVAFGFFRPAGGEALREAR